MAILNQQQPSDVLKLTRTDGVPVYILKSQIVSFSADIYKPNYTHINLMNGFQVVREKPEEFLREL